MCSGSALYEAANYCTDEELLRRRALYEKLERCLWRFSMENGGSGNYYPVLNRITRRWSITCTEIQRFGPSFKTHEACARAIELNAEDIRQLIAKEFDVKEEQVSVSISKVYSGYGIGEYEDYEIYATVNK